MSNDAGRLGADPIQSCFVVAIRNLGAALSWPLLGWHLAASNAVCLTQAERPWLKSPAGRALTSRPDIAKFGCTTMTARSFMHSTG